LASDDFKGKVIPWKKDLKDIKKVSVTNRKKGLSASSG
jgi:hypothetical protein